jgi:fatty-acyl-CoA synthase
VAETACTEADGQKRIGRDVVEAAMQIDITVSRVYLVPPRWLVKSSAGKPSRTANRSRALEEFGASAANRFG